VYLTYNWVLSKHLFAFLSVGKLQQQRIILRWLEYKIHRSFNYILMFLEYVSMVITQ